MLYYSKSKKNSRKNTSNDPFSSTLEGISTLASDAKNGISRVSKRMINTMVENYHEDGHIDDLDDDYMSDDEDEDDYISDDEDDYVPVAPVAPKSKVLRGPGAQDRHANVIRKNRHNNIIRRMEKLENLLLVILILLALIALKILG